MDGIGNGLTLVEVAVGAAPQLDGHGVTLNVVPSESLTLSRGQGIVRRRYIESIGFVALRYSNGREDSSDEGASEVHGRSVIKS